jgi:hypothetical protein
MRLVLALAVLLTSLSAVAQNQIAVCNQPTDDPIVECTIGIASLTPVYVRWENYLADEADELAAYISGYAEVDDCDPEYHYFEANPCAKRRSDVI